MDRGSAMVDTKGIGQPFTLKGTSETDFGEWTHKVRTFRDDILTDLTWDCRQDLRSFAEEPHDILDVCVWRPSWRR